MDQNINKIQGNIINIPEIYEINHKEIEKNWILDELKYEIDNELNDFIESYKQGFIQIADVSELNVFSDILMEFYDNFAYKLILDTNFNDLFSKLYLETINSHKSLKYLKNTLQKIIEKVKVKVIFKSLKLTNHNYVAYVKKLGFYAAMLMPDNIKSLIINKKGTGTIESVLRSKEIEIKYENEQKNYRKNEIKRSFLSFKNFNFSTEKNLKNFNFGIEINDIFDIEKFENITPNFIKINPEISYLKTNGILNFDSRLDFYKALKKSFPDVKIILNLPKLDVLYAYHFSMDDYILDQANFIKHYLLYIKEIEAITSIFDQNINITLPHLTDEIEFKVLKSQLKHWLKLKGKHVDAIGLEVETDSAYDYLDHFKKFDFCVIDMDRLYEEINIDDDKKTFISDLSYINQRLKIRKKDVYLIGKDLSDYATMTKLVKKGFKKFVINTQNYESFCEIVTNYNNSRGKYKKVK